MGFCYLSDMKSELENVIRIAKLAHAGQFRKDGVSPSIQHPAAVALRVKGDVMAEMVAWLHDVLEDSSMLADDLLAKGVPLGVVNAVELMSHARWEPYQEYLERIKSSDLAVKVKVADMLSNLADQPSDRAIKKYAKGLLFLLD